MLKLHAQLKWKFTTERVLLNLMDQELPNRGASISAQWRS